MTLRELYDVNGDWNYPVSPIFEFHYPAKDGSFSCDKPYRKCGWCDLPEETRNTKVLYFRTISKGRVWIELDI